MASKRHTPLQLLARLVAWVEAPAPPAVRTRALLTDLLRARFGDIAVRDSAVAALDALSDGALAHERLAIRDQMRGAVQFPAHGWDATFALPRVRVTGAALSGDYVLELDGAPEGLLRLQVVYLIRATGGRLRACKADDCGRLFVREGKREFCSQRCQKRIYMRLQRAAGHQ